MKLWHCVIWTHGADGRKKYLFDVTADTKDEAEVMARQRRGNLPFTWVAA